MKKKLIVLMTTLAMAVTACCVGMFAAVMTTAADDTVKIMSIGDSITDGYGIAGSYRKFMYYELAQKGYEIDMVGSKGDSWALPTYTDETTGVTFEYDDENTGYSGYAIQAYPGRSGILETLQSTNCLATTSPDIVILQIGTNDVIDNHEIDASGERLGGLIEYIFDNIPSDSAVFVTTIPDLDPNRSDVYSWFNNYRHSDDWQTQYSDDEAETYVQAAVDKYNSIIKSTVEQLRSSHANLYAGDINSVITDVTSQLVDGVHPNNTGYQLMGQYWASVIASYLSGGQITPPVTDTTMTTTTTTMPTTTTTITTETTTETTMITEETEAPVSTTSEITTETTEQTTETSTTLTETSEVTSSTEEQPDFYDGDVNGDGQIHLSDAVVLLKYLLHEQSLSEEAFRHSDMNQDGKVNGFDLALLRQKLFVEMDN